jgi:hypothetical protein
MNDPDGFVERVRRAVNYLAEYLDATLRFGALTRVVRSFNLYEGEIMTRPKLRVAAIERRGDYQPTSEVFERFMAIAARPAS